MKTIVAVIYSLFLLLCSCTSDNISGGAKGVIKFGEGDCTLDQSFWYYNNYNGYAYCINKNVSDTLTNAFGENLFSNCDSVWCSNGKYVFALDPGLYYIFIRENPIRGLDNLITVHYQSLTETELFFYRCL
ncbi:MAG TPA: hypothetical protein PLM49_01670 [Bacteroidales bacterium]|nr:hypothetical protein [Bacteroidales bacterium]